MSLTAKFYTVDKSPRSTRLPSSGPVRYRDIDLQGATIEAENAAPLPLKKCFAELSPSQSFNGYDRPWKGGDGLNKFSLDPAVSLLSETDVSTTYDAQTGTLTIEKIADNPDAAIYLQSDEYELPASTPINVPIDVYVNIRIHRDLVGSMPPSWGNTAYQLAYKQPSMSDFVALYRESFPSATPNDFFRSAESRSGRISNYNLNEPVQFRVWMIPSMSKNSIGTKLTVSEFSVTLESSEQAIPYANVCPVVAPSAPAILRRDVDGVISDWRLESFPSGYFGGYFDAIRGRLVNQWIEIPSYAGEELPAEWMSSLDLYAAGTTPTLGAQVFYRAAGTGEVYQVQPWDVRTLQGDNVLTWSGGNLDITYTAYRSTTPPVPLELPIDIKYPTDVLHPELMLNFSQSPVDYNYLYIPAFDRYYWLNGWQSVSNGLWSVTGTVDELASWREQILDLNLYVLRAASEGDGRIIDNLYPALADVTRQILYKDASPWGVESGTVGVYVVSICGSGETAYYIFAPSEYKQFFDKLLGDDYIDSVMSYLPDWKTVYPGAPLQINPLQYVAGVKWFPFTSLSGVPVTPVSSIPVGLGSVAQTAYKLAPLAVTVAYDRTIPISSIHPQSARGVYLNLAPYSHIQAYVPPFGLVTINPATALAAKSVRLTIAVDLRSGDGALRLLTPDGAIETELHAPIGVSVAIGQTLTAGYGLLDAAGAAAGIGASIMSGNIAGAITGATSAIGNVIASQVPTSRTIGSPESIGALRGPLVIYSDHYAVAEEDITHRGRPLCANRRLGDLTGYVLVADADFTIPCTEEENKQIRAFLEGGVFIE